MKISQLKTLIKEAVKEAIQDELKDILLEAVKSSKMDYAPPLQTEQKQHYTTPSPFSDNPPSSPLDVRDRYAQILNETSTVTSQYAQKFVPQPGADTFNGSLPAGSVGLDQISQLLNSK